MEKTSSLRSALVEDLKAFVLEGDFITQCIFQPLPRLFAEHSVAAGGNVLGMERNVSNGILLQINFTTRTVQEAEFAYSKSRALIDTLSNVWQQLRGVIWTGYI
jgi:hypothetical protein